MNQEIKKTVLILEKIISLKNEAVFGDFVFNFLKELSKFDSIKKNYIHKERFKIVATKGTPKLIFLSHLDTVSLFEKQKFGPQKDKFYGLGAKDMKGGIAALLLALKESKKVNNLGVIFYTGEETDQAGIRSLLKNCKRK